MNCVKVDFENKRTIFVKTKIPKQESDTDVIVKVAYAGFCGTDLHIIKGEYFAKDKVILGHEIAGIVESVSEKYNHLKAGDRVAVNPNLSCGICIPCKRQRNNFCDLGGAKQANGVVQDGGMAEYVKVHISQITKVPVGVSLDQAVLCEPLSCIVHGLDKLHDLDTDSKILIIGAGIIGFLWSSLLYGLGHRKVIISEPNIDRRKIISQSALGYKCEPWEDILKENPDFKADICIDCSGNTNAMQAAIPVINNGGTFLIFGVAHPEKTLTLKPFDLFRREITVIGVTINTPDSFERAMSYLEIMSRTHLNIDKIGIKKFSLDEHEKAVQAFQSGSFTKIMLDVCATELK